MIKNIMTSQASNSDEKYLKRREQKKKERLHQALYLLASAALVLIYTWWTLLSTVPERSSQGVLSPSTLRKVSRKTPPKQSLQQPGVQQHEGGVLGGIGKLFGEDQRIVDLKERLREINADIIENQNRGIRWVKAELLPALHGGEEEMGLTNLRADKKNKNGAWKNFFRVKRMSRPPMTWEEEQIYLSTFAGVDFTQHSYKYPEKLMEPPATLGDYPPLRPLKDIMEAWPQDDIDSVPLPFKETLIHFDYTKPEEVEAARKFRDAKLPFKFINVPEIVAAGIKWSDEYVSANFDLDANQPGSYPLAGGTAQESQNNFFAFFNEAAWSVAEMGLPPTRNNDWTYAKWAEHARYADAVGLDANAPHFYWQSGVPREERLNPESAWTFISRDLPSMSSPTETFFVFEPESQKGIQCRFGERGVTAATHYDSGRNMVAMISGAKRYILSPPNQCPKLGLVTTRANPIFRHSLLNFGHLNYMDNEEMPADERAWLERSAEALAIDTVLKAGEVLYIPSFWFHYISSLQKSAQCNVRSGVDVEADEVFGGKYHVTDGCTPS